MISCTSDESMRPKPGPADIKPPCVSYCRGPNDHVEARILRPILGDFRSSVVVSLCFCGLLGPYTL